MRLFLSLSASLLLCATPTFSYTVEELWLEFDARQLSAAEKRILQTSLAFAGDYNGMLDGAWGNASQQSLKKYLSKSDIYEPLPNWAVTLVAFDAAKRIDDEGWTERYFEPLDMSILVPAGNVRDGSTSENFVNLNHNSSSLGYSLTIADPDKTERFHAFALAEAASLSEPYTVRKEDLWITSVNTAAGLTLYTRSDFRRGSWSTIILSAASADKGILAAVTGSIVRGEGSPIDLPEGTITEGFASIASVLKKGEIEEASPNRVYSMMEEFSGISPDLPSNPPVAATAQTPDEPADRGWSGTGFVVSTDGHVLTNAHVAENCRNLTVDGHSASLVAIEENFDLALLRVADIVGQKPASFAPKPAMLNADITIAGYPLANLLGGLNVTRGAVTSLKGMGGNSVQMQISAPVQPGNSGGPAVNSSGQIVGVVVSKLNAQIVADATGDIPQNVNFAIRGEIAKLFLFQNGVEPTEASSDEILAPELLAEELKGFTRFILCE